MAHSLSSKKRIRQNLRRRALNRARKRSVHLKIRAFDDALTAQDEPKAAETLKVAIKQIDQIAAKGTLHRNTAGRRKAKLQRRYNALAAQ